ncbi:DUF4255 domain-containing protein [Sinorhizobium sp. BG8]|uniref:DUF4255 domain-containing protein n=1 Tax=Sinorhizobium sp. BG8 TaxID=2613773 RepID=UPI00193DD101|nr:DUF4255 domain-containing protein [Sinorhizobium sp. BG8]QRM54377.1 DUF4255 domain-containing protein [Sinorhizobium sp. BG8]
MATHEAIAAVSRTLRHLLLDRMTTAAEVTLAPPDVTPQGVDRRVNLYLYQVLENGGLKNQDIPGRAHPGSPGRPPLSLDLRFLLSTYSATEDAIDSDLNAQTLLGDAMSVLHEFGVHIDELVMTKNVGSKRIGDPVIDVLLADEFERLKVVLHPMTLDDLSRVWSAMPQANFRRSVVYEATVVQIETVSPRTRPAPVERRAISATVRRAPAILAAFVLPPPNGPIGDIRAAIGATLVIETEGARGVPVFAVLGTLDPVPLPASSTGRYEFVVPDDSRLQPGPLELHIVVEVENDTITGALDRGTTGSATRRLRSNTVLLQLVPNLTVLTVLGPAGARVLRLDGTRLWHRAAKIVEVVLGDRSRRIVKPPSAAPTDPPTPTRIEVPVAGFDLQAPGDYPVAVLVDGVRSIGPELIYEHA